MKLLIAVSLLVSSLAAQAGGIVLGKQYTGMFPLTEKPLVVEIENGMIVDGTPKPVRVRAEGSMVEMSGTLHFIRYTPLESLFELRDTQGNVLANLVTEPPCTDARTAALIFPSGLTTVVHRSQE